MNEEQAKIAQQDYHAQYGGVDYRVRIAELTKENADLRAKLERAEAELVAMRSDLATSNSKRDSAEACVVEMREVIRDNNYHDESHDENPSPDCDVCHALSTQCGVGLLENVKRLREALSAVMKLIDDGILVRDTR